MMKKKFVWLGDLYNDFEEDEDNIRTRIIIYASLIGVIILGLAIPEVIRWLFL